tara:strand:- start:130 stop:774 length:645 start_codon:yes stop_codon:yes gene_type:complete
MKCATMPSEHLIKRIVNGRKLRRVSVLRRERVFAARRRNHLKLLAAYSKEECAVLCNLAATQKKVRKPRGNNQVITGAPWDDLCHPMNNRSFGDNRCTGNHERFLLYMRVTKPHFDEIVLKCLEKYTSIKKEVMERKVGIVFRYLASTDDLKSIAVFFGIGKTTAQNHLVDGVKIILNVYQCEERRAIKFPNEPGLNKVSDWFYQNKECFYPGF